MYLSYHLFKGFLKQNQREKTRHGSDAKVSYVRHSKWITTAAGSLDHGLVPTTDVFYSFAVRKRMAYCLEQACLLRLLARTCAPDNQSVVCLIDRWPGSRRGKEVVVVNCCLLHSCTRDIITSHAYYYSNDNACCRKLHLLYSDCHPLSRRN